MRTKFTCSGTNTPSRASNLQRAHNRELMPDHPSEYPQATHPNGPSDDVLITMYQGGDTLAFRTLVDRHRERVRNVIYSVLNAP